MEERQSITQQIKRGLSYFSRDRNRSPEAETQAAPVMQQGRRWLYYLQWGATVLGVFGIVLILLSHSAYKWISPSWVGMNQLQFLIAFVLAGFFPISAFAYVSFQRKTQLRKLAGDFWLLGIDIRGEQSKQVNIPQDLEDLKPAHYSKYFTQREVQTQVSLNYFIQSLFAMLAAIVGLSLFDWPPETEIFPLSPNTLHALQFGFLGSYIYAAHLIYRRYTTLDLQPTVYLNCMITIIAGIVFNFVAFEALNALASNPGATQPPAISQATSTSSPTGTSESSEATGNPAAGTIPPPPPQADAAGDTPPAASQANQTETPPATGLAGGFLAIIAFSLGYFPYLAIRWFNRIGHTALGERQRRADALELGLIDGISQFHEVRLRDEGIDNVQNLASAALDELLINTRFSAKQVVEWVDQAVLYLYLESSEIESFRRGGVRSFSDLEHLWGPLYEMYYVFGKPERKMIETNRRTKMNHSLTDQRSINLHTYMLAQLQTDGAKKEERTALEKFWDEERKDRALQLFQSIPDRLDALYLATKLGPNVAHIKNYWKRADETQIHFQDQSRTLRKVPELFLAFGRLGNLDPARPSFVDHLDFNSYLSYRELKVKGIWDAEETWWVDAEAEIEEETRKLSRIGKARVAREAGLAERAIKTYEEAIQEEPGRVDIRLELVWAYLAEEQKVDQSAEPAEVNKMRKAFLDKALPLADAALKLAEESANTGSSNVDGWTGEIVPSNARGWVEDSKVTATRALQVVIERLLAIETDETEKVNLEKRRQELKGKLLESEKRQLQNQASKWGVPESAWVDAGSTRQTTSEAAGGSTSE